MRLILIALCLVPLLAACDRPNDPDPAPGSTTSQTALGRTVERAMDEARRKLATENIRLKEGIDIDINGVKFGKDVPGNLPEAEITPQGDLLIAGKQVELDARQRRLLLDYRAGIVAIAETGMDIGVQGADLGMKAASEAIAGVFSGDTSGIEQRVEAEAEKIKASAQALCDQLPGLLASQDALAAALPAFKPYATMDRQDVDDCEVDGDAHTQRDRAEVRDEIRRGIRDGIRQTIQTAVQGAGLAERGTQDAAEPENDTAPAAAE